MKKSIYSDLPQIVYIYAVEDHGENGAATCPHCNAIGRYIVKFQCEDGTTRGAMRGCFQKFPISTLARYHAAIVEKQKEYSAKGWSLNQFDTAMLEIIERHARGEISRKDATKKANDIRERSAAHNRNKYR